MSSTAQITIPPNGTDLDQRLPLGGEERTLGQLIGRSVTAEQYLAFREALGGAELGRERAKRIIPVLCNTEFCRCRLTHVAGDPPRFSAAFADATHAPGCPEAHTGDGSGGGAGIGTEGATENGFGPAAHKTGRDPDDAAVHAAAERGVDPARPRLYKILEPHNRRSEHGRAQPEGLRGNHRNDSESIALRELLRRALAGRVREGSQVQWHETTYRLASVVDIDALNDGASVAVYGSLKNAVPFGQQPGFLALRAFTTGTNFQVWATSREVISWLLYQRGGVAPAEPPTWTGEVPFLVFGRLKREDRILQVTIERSDRLVLLSPIPSPRPRNAPMEPTRQAQAPLNVPATHPAAPRRAPTAVSAEPRASHQDAVTWTAPAQQGSVTRLATQATAAARPAPTAAAPSTPSGEGGSGRPESALTRRRETSLGAIVGQLWFQLRQWWRR